LKIDPGKVVTDVKDRHRYAFESFSASRDNFDGRFTDFVNQKYESGWKYKDCTFDSEGDTRHAYCLFKNRS
jgi:hypothetical protein